MSWKLSPLLVAVSFGAFGALHGLEKGPGPELLPIPPSVQNAKIKLVPQGGGNPIPEIVILEPVEDAGVVKIYVEGGDVDVGGQRTGVDTWHTINKDDSWPPNVWLDNDTLNPITLSGHFKTIVDDYTMPNPPSSDPYPFPGFHVAINETSDGYDLYILYSKNGIRIPIET